VVHHALCQIIEPAFERSFIYHSYANRLGKGTHRALDTCQKWMRRYRYVMHCDIRQFFPSIDHQVLKRILFKRIQDGGLRRLIKRVIDSGAGVLQDAYDMVYFPGDDLFAVNRPRGLPIGNLTSQFWANCYMNGFDQFVNRQLGCRAYLRYVDDFLLFADRKSLLWQWRNAIIERLGQLRLTLYKLQAQVRPTVEGIRFLGFVVYPTHRRLLRRKGIYFRRKLHRLLKAYYCRAIDRETLNASIQGWINHVRYADTWALRGDILGEVVL
jgi:retron-type reverse transcriptase